MKSFEITDGSNEPAYTVTIKLGSLRYAQMVLAVVERALNTARKNGLRHELPGQLRMPV